MTKNSTRSGFGTPKIGLLALAALATAAITSAQTVPPLFSKSFAPDPIVLGGTSTLTFTIDNSANAAAANNLSFVDNLPAGVVVANPPNISHNCAPSTAEVTAAPGTGVISLTGGFVQAVVWCSISVDVTSAVLGTHVNTTGDLTSSLGNSGPATDSLTVLASLPPLFSKSFAPDPIVLGGTSTLTFTVDNTASVFPATGLSFADTFPAGVVIASPTGAASTCGGTLTHPPGNVFSYAGGTVAAGTTCTVQINVTSSTRGTYVNTSGNLTSSLGNSGPATDTLTVSAVVPTVLGPGLVLLGGLLALAGWLVLRRRERLPV